MTTKQPIECCELLPTRIEFRAVLDVDGLKERVQLLRSEGYGYTRFYGCKVCGTVWRETSTPIGHADKYVCERLGQS